MYIIISANDKLNKGNEVQQPRHWKIIQKQGNPNLPIDLLIPTRLKNQTLYIFINRHNKFKYTSILCLYLDTLPTLTRVIDRRVNSGRVTYLLCADTSAC